MNFCSYFLFCPKIAAFVEKGHFRQKEFLQLMCFNCQKMAAFVEKVDYFKNEFLKFLCFAKGYVTIFQRGLRAL